MNNNEELKVDEMSADEVVEAIRQKRLELWKLMIDIEKKEKEHEVADVVYRKKDDDFYKASDKHFDLIMKDGKVADTDEMALYGFLGGIVSGVATLIVDSFVRNGGNIRKIDNVREYFVNHPDKLQMMQDVLHTDDINLISGYVMGTDSAAHSLWTASGLQDFFWNNVCAAGVDALLVGGGTLAAAVGFAAAWHTYYNMRKVNTNKNRNEKAKVRNKALNHMNDLYHELRDMKREKEELGADIEKMVRAQFQNQSKNNAVRAF